MVCLLSVCCLSVVWLFACQAVNFCVGQVCCARVCWVCLFSAGEERTPLYGANGARCRCYLTDGGEGRGWAGSACVRAGWCRDMLDAELPDISVAFRIYEEAVRSS